MNSIKDVNLFGGGGISSPASLDPYIAGSGITEGSLRPKNGRSYGSVEANQGLTVILETTEKSTFSYMFLTSNGNQSVDTQQIKVTVNGIVIHDVISSLVAGSGAIIMLLGDAFYAAVSTTQSVQATDGGAVFKGCQMNADTLKIEIATGDSITVHLRSDLEMIL